MSAKTNLGASIRARLLNQAKAVNVEFGLMLTRFALERLLYRLSISSHRDQFLLKGALLFDLWFDQPHRPTRDADLLGFGTADLPVLEATFQEICVIPVADGIAFAPASVKAVEIRQDANYAGIRITLTGELHGARSRVQVDIGFGDVVTPAAEEADYPAILADLPTARLRVYPRYTVIAEKFEAIVALGITNSRMKDFFDLWILTRQSDLDPTTLRQALVATFTRRGTTLTGKTPTGLSPEFSADIANPTSRIRRCFWQLVAIFVR